MMKKRSVSHNHFHFHKLGLLAILFSGACGIVHDKTNLLQTSSARDGQTIQGNTYYVDSERGSDDASGRTIAEAWKTLKPVQSLSLKPGDMILLRRGSQWDSGLLLRSSGTQSAPIIIRSYGEGGAPPIIRNPSAGKWGAAITLSGSYNIIEGLMLRDANQHGINIQKGANYNQILDNEITAVGIGVQVDGQFNRLTRNHVHDLHMVVDTPAVESNPKSGRDDFGAACFWLQNTDNEVSFNRGINCIGHSYDYKTDGGFVELFGVTDRSHIHHNYAKNTNGFVELGGPGSVGSALNVRMHHNILVDVVTPSLCLHAGPTFALDDIRFENNTVYKTAGGGYTQIGCEKNNQKSTMLVFRNNLIVSDVPLAASGNFEHKNNVYEFLQGVNPGFDLHATERMGQAGLRDPAKEDFQLNAGSSAIDAGFDFNYGPDYSGHAPVNSSLDAGALEFGTDIMIHAAGTAAQGVYPTMQLLIDGVVVASWSGVDGDLSRRRFKSYSYHHPLPVTANRIQVAFANDGGQKGERDLTVDRIFIDGRERQTEDPSVQITSLSPLCTSGNLKSEQLYCNGSISYP